MNLSTSVLGTSVVKQLSEHATSAVLQIGSDTLTRGDLARVGCFNFNAAKNLSKILHNELNVKNLQHVFDTVAPNDLVLPGLGAVSLAVLGAAFEVKKIGGRAPLENYIQRHNRTLTTFHTMKEHARANTNGASSTTPKSKK